MGTEYTDIGRGIEAAPDEVLTHVLGEKALPCRIVALRWRMNLSRRRRAERVGLDAPAIQDCEQGRRVPDRTARVLLTVIDSDPEAVVRATAQRAEPSRWRDRSVAVRPGSTRPAAEGA